MLGKGGCSASYFWLTLCTSFQQQSTLFSVVSVREFTAELTPLTYCNLGGIVRFDDFFYYENYFCIEEKQIFVCIWFQLQLLVKISVGWSHLELELDKKTAIGASLT